MQFCSEMIIQLRNKVAFALLGVMVFGLSPGPANGDPFRLDSNWRYLHREAEGEKKESIGQFYNLVFGKSLAAGSQFTGNFRYNRESAEIGEDTQTMNPSAQLDFRNDLFLLNLNGSIYQQEPGEEADFTTYAWNANWTSALKDWPQARLYYGRALSDDEADPSLRDAETTTYGGSLNYQWSDFHFYYDYNSSETTDHVNDSFQESDSHRGQFKFGRKIGSRVTITGSEQISHVETSSETRIMGGGFFLPVNRFLLEAFSGEGNTPQLGTLPPNPALIDDDLVTSAGIEITQTSIDQALSVRSDFNPVNQIRIHFDREIHNENILEWSVYTSDDGLIWSQLSSPFQVSYEKDFNRNYVVLDVPQIMARYLKVVVGSSEIGLEPVFVTEVAVGTFKAATAREFSQNSQSTEFRTDLGLSYQATDDWVLGYGIGHTIRKTDPGANISQLNQNFSSNYSPSRFFSLLLGASENRDSFEEQVDRLSRSYSLSINSAPFNSLDLSFGYTHSDGYADGNRNQGLNTISASVIARLFPDLAANLSTTWTESKNYIANLESQSYGFRLQTTARISPRLNLGSNFDYTHSESTSPVSESSQNTVRYGAVMSYRPSDLLVFQSSLSRDQEREITNFSGNVFFRWTPKIQTNGLVTIQIEGERAETYNLLLNWQISRIFALDTNYNLRINRDSEVWEVLANLSANF